MKTFDKYISMINDKNVYESINERWQIGISTSSDKFEHFSFVNGIATPKGGKHVDYITKQITSKLSAHIKKKMLPYNSHTNSNGDKFECVPGHCAG